MNDEAPSWDALRRRLTRAPYSPESIAAVGLAIDNAERMLGPSWPGRQFERMGWWPGEFNLLMFHAAALPQFLAFVMRLESVANEPTFATVLRGLKRGVASTDWRHALLQLEVHRALRSPGTAITFEPEISGSRNKADLMITPTEGSAFLVETTSPGRADVDQAWEEYEHNVWQAVTCAFSDTPIEMLAALCECAVEVDVPSVSAEATPQIPISGETGRRWQVTGAPVLRSGVRVANGTASRVTADKTAGHRHGV